jgi:hypothetical protein
MDQEIAAHLKGLQDAVRATAIPEDSQRTALWCLKQLPAQYALSRQTNESRYDDEITRLVQVLIQQLAARGNCPEARKLAASLPEDFRLLHERLGLSFLALKPPAPQARKSPKKK